MKKHTVVVRRGCGDGEDFFHATVRFYDERISDDSAINVEVKIARSTIIKAAKTVARHGANLSGTIAARKIER